MNVSLNRPIFPDRLLDWAGHRAGGVRKLFHDQASRPSGKLIRTGLLERLETWVSDVIAGKPSTPRVVLLVERMQSKRVSRCRAPGSRGPDLRPERKRRVNAHHRAGLPVERQRAVDRGIERAAGKCIDHDHVARRLHAEGAGRSLA